MIEQGIALSEVAAVTKLTVAQVEEEAAALSLFVGRDWANRPALSEWDASQLVSGALRRQQENDRRWLQHREETSRWETDRKAEFLRAHAVAYREAGGQMAGRRSDVAAQRAGDQAVLVWEKRNPAPRWAGQQTASLWRRLTDALTGAGQ